MIITDDPHDPRNCWVNRFQFPTQRKARTFIGKFIEYNIEFLINLAGKSKHPHRTSERAKTGIPATANMAKIDRIRGQRPLDHAAKRSSGANLRQTAIYMGRFITAYRSQFLSSPSEETWIFLLIWKIEISFSTVRHALEGDPLLYGRKMVADKAISTLGLWW